jgi:hypothetical protein
MYFGDTFLGLHCFSPDRLLDLLPSLCENDRQFLKDTILDLQWSWNGVCQLMPRTNVPAMMFPGLCVSVNWRVLCRFCSQNENENETKPITWIRRADNPYEFFENSDSLSSFLLWSLKYSFLCSRQLIICLVEVISRRHNNTEPIGKTRSTMSAKSGTCFQTATIGAELRFWAQNSAQHGRRISLLMICCKIK